MKISTKTGDSGYTSLFGGQRVKKYDVFIHTLGELDELNSFLGFAKCYLRDDLILGEENVFFEILERAQDDIYRIMSVVGNKFEPALGATPISTTDILYLEGYVENFEEICGKLNKFVKPGENELSARLHVARSVCRRAERAFVELLDIVSLKGEFQENADNVLKYINRLSDLLFLMAILPKK